MVSLRQPQKYSAEKRLIMFFKEFYNMFDDSKFQSQFQIALKIIGLSHPYRKKTRKNSAGKRKVSVLKTSILSFLKCFTS